MHRRVRLLLACAALLAGCKKSTLPDLFGEEGFAALRPPTRLLAPGTMIYKLSENPLQVGIACTQEQSLGPGLEVLASRSTSSSFSDEIQHDIRIAPDDLGPITAGAAYSKVSSITARLSDVSVHELPVSTVTERIDQRSDACKAAVELLRNDEKPVGLVTAVIEADVTYTLDFERGVSAEVQADVAGKLGAELGFESAKASSNVITGEGLYWGIRELGEEAFRGLVPRGEDENSFVGVAPIRIVDQPPLAQ